MQNRTAHRSFALCVLLAAALLAGALVQWQAPQAFADDTADVPGQASSTETSSGSGASTDITAGTAPDTSADSKSKAKKKAATKPFKGKGTYFITLAKSSKRVLGMKGSKRTEGVGVVVAKKKATNLLRFKITPASKGRYYIKNTATGRLLTADLNEKGTAGTADMFASFGGKYAKNYQQWEIVVNSDKTVSISNPKSGLRLSLAGKKSLTGTKLKLAKASDSKKGLASAHQRFKLTKTKKNSKEAVTIGVPCYWQNPQLPTGCESVALTNALNYWGFGLAKTTIAARWLPYGDGGVYDFIGSPYNSSGWIICAPGITNTANRYLNTKDTDVRATNVSGTSLKSLRKYLDKGYPVVVWTTMYMGSPWNYSGSHRAGGHSYPFYHNNHAVVLTGYNPKTGNYQVSDSLSGRVWRSGGSFRSIYDTMGKQAVVLHDDGIDL